MPPLVAPPPSCQDYIIVHGWCWFYSEPVNCLEVASVKEICPKGKRGGIIHSRSLCPPLQRVHACGLVVPKLFSLWLACCPRGSPCAFHFHSSLTTVLLNTEPHPPTTQTPHSNPVISWYQAYLPCHAVRPPAGSRRGTDCNINSAQKSRTLSVYF